MEEREDFQHAGVEMRGEHVMTAGWAPGRENEGGTEAVRQG